MPTDHDNQALPMGKWYRSTTSFLRVPLVLRRAFGQGGGKSRPTVRHACGESNIRSIPLGTLSGVLRDEPITAETDPSGTPKGIVRRGRRYRARVLDTWQAPGEARLYRLQLRAEDGECAVAEVRRSGAVFRLSRWWD